MRISVVLPQPDGPRIEKNEPLGMSKETSSTAVKAPKRLVMLEAFEIGGGLSSWAAMRGRGQLGLPPPGRRIPAPERRRAAKARSAARRRLDLLERLAFHVLHPRRDVGEELEVLDVGIVKAALTAAFLSSGSRSMPPLTAAMAPVLSDISVTISGA
jgi:hypothetical protein